MRKTKIVATLGPATDAPGILGSIIDAGVDIVRFNMSHNEHADHARRMAQVAAIRERTGKPIAAMLDTRGPEIRTGIFERPVELLPGQRFILSADDRPGDESGCSISCPELTRAVHPSQRILIDDGAVELIAEKCADGEIQCTVISGGQVSSRKGINCPGLHLPMPYVSERDRADLIFGARQGFDYIAASFVRSADDIAALRSALADIGWEDARIIAKIENAEGVAAMDEIISAADGIMAARGDMGVEIPLEDIPVIQKRLIARTVASGKPVITATQMLDSMMYHPRPTRAETADVANAIYDGTDAVMLSGETAAGLYPVESVRMMAAIAERAETDIDYRGRYFKDIAAIHCGDITTAVSHAAVMTAHELDARAIIIVTETGFTARMVSRYRPDCPIFAGAPDDRVYRRLALSWGVVPMLTGRAGDQDELFASAIAKAAEDGYIRPGDRIIMTAGVPIGKAGHTNMISVAECG